MAEPRSVPANALDTSAAPAAQPPQPGEAAVGPSSAPAGPHFSQQELEPLLKRLEAEGFPRETLNRIFYDRRLQRLDRVVTYNVLNPDSARIYDQFVTPFAIRLAKTFRRHHARELGELERRYSVSPEVIVGILLVETQFGTAALPYRLLEVFTTLILDAGPPALERHYQRMKADYPGLERAWVEERLAKKAEWAYGELKALLTIRDQLRVKSLYELKGSYAGAFGMPQFMPSSYALWAVDGNHDQLVDLDNAADAMASIANFLVQHGWRPGATLEQKMHAVWEYNRSMHYVHTIFTVALRMTRPPRKRGSAPPEPDQAEMAMVVAKPGETPAKAAAGAAPTVPPTPAHADTGLPAIGPNARTAPLPGSAPEVGSTAGADSGVPGAQPGEAKSAPPSEITATPTL